MSISKLVVNSMFSIKEASDLISRLPVELNEQKKELPLLWAKAQVEWDTNGHKIGEIWRETLVYVAEVCAALPNDTREAFKAVVTSFNKTKLDEAIEVVSTLALKSKNPEIFFSANNSKLPTHYFVYEHLRRKMAEMILLPDNGTAKELIEAHANAAVLNDLCEALETEEKNLFDSEIVFKKMLQFCVKKLSVLSDEEKGRILKCELKGPISNEELEEILKADLSSNRKIFDLFDVVKEIAKFESKKASLPHDENQKKLEKLLKSITQKYEDARVDCQLSEYKMKDWWNKYKTYVDDDMLSLYTKQLLLFSDTAIFQTLIEKQQQRDLSKNTLSITRDNIREQLEENYEFHRSRLVKSSNPPIINKEIDQRIVQTVNQLQAMCESEENLSIEQLDEIANTLLNSHYKSTLQFYFAVWAENAQEGMFDPILDDWKKILSEVQLHNKSHL